MGETNPGRSISLFTGDIFTDVRRLADALKTFSEHFNLITPGGAVGTELPLLHAVGVSFVFVGDLERETYELAGKRDRGLGKTILDRISAGTGINWNPHLCGLVPVDNPHPHIAHYQSAGTVKGLDGAERMIIGSKRIDLRAERGTDIEAWGSDAQEIYRISVLRAAKINKNKKAEDPTVQPDPWPQILQARQHILSLAETKAKNRAIRSLGIRTSYSPEEIAKGFAVVRLQFTGKSDDPEIQRAVAMMIAEQALSSGSRLYPSERHRELAPAPIPVKAVVKIAAVEEPEDDDDPPCMSPAAAAASIAKSEPPAETKKDPAPETKAEPPAAESQAPKPPALDPEIFMGSKQGVVMRSKCSELTLSELRGRRAYYEKTQGTCEPRFAAKNAEELKGIVAWIAFLELDPRQGTLPGGQPDSVSY